MKRSDVPELIWEFSVLATGVDEPSTAVWLWTRLDQEMMPDTRNALLRACAHWDACEEDLRNAIGPFFGLGEPHNERWPTLQAIKADYEVVLSLVMMICDEEPQP